MVLVRSYRRYSLRRTSNLYQARGGPHRRRFGRIRCRSHRRIVDPNLSRVSLVGEPLESAIQCARNFLFCSHRRLRWCGHNCILPTFSERRTALVCSSHFGGRCGDHGHRRHSVLSRTAFMAAASRRDIRDNRIAAAPTLMAGKRWFDLRFRNFANACSRRRSFALEPGVQHRQQDQRQKC